MTSELKEWLKSYIEAHGYGGQARISELLDIEKPTLNRFLNDPERDFHKLTMNASALCVDRQRENYVHIPVIREIEMGKWVFEFRKNEEESVTTWRMK